MSLSSFERSPRVSTSGIEKNLFSDDLQTILLLQNHDDLGHGTCRNCGVRPADGSDKQCSMCRNRGY